MHAHEKNAALSFPDFHENPSYTTALRIDSLHRISFRAYKKCGIQFYLQPSVKYGLNCADFRENQSY
jgi:hypothetical protein